MGSGERLIWASLPKPDHRGPAGIVENRPQQAPPYYDDAWHFDDVLVDEPEETMAAFVSGVGRHFGY